MSWNFITENYTADDLLLDCRSEALYQQGSIKGAIGAAFIKKPYGSGPQSMGKLSGHLKAVIELAKSRRSVIVFDEGVGMYASRLAWLLRGAGMKNPQILKTKFADIPAAAIGPGENQLQADPLDSPINLNGVVSINFMQKNLTKIQLLDVRTPQEFSGDLPRMSNPEAGDVCGRIPGSINWDWRRLYTANGELKDRGAVMDLMRDIRLIQERPTVIYDYNGARSATTALVLTGCGYQGISIYLGSWMEWRKSKLPKQDMSIWKGL